MKYLAESILFLDIEVHNVFFTSYFGCMAVTNTPGSGRNEHHGEYI